MVRERGGRELERNGNGRGLGGRVQVVVAGDQGRGGGRKGCGSSMLCWNRELGCQNLF